MELAELVKSVAAISAQISTFQGAMDSVNAKLAAMDEGDKDKEDKEPKGAQDSEEDKDKEKAMDSEEDKEKDDKKDAMDSAMKQIKALTAQVAALTAAPAALDSGAIMAEIAKKNELVAKVSAHIGTFACDSMSYGQVAEYAAEKLGLPKDNAAIRVESYLAAKPASTTAYGMDAKAVKSSDGAAQLAKHFA